MLLGASTRCNDCSSASVDPLLQRLRQHATVASSRCTGTRQRCDVMTDEYAGIMDHWSQSVPSLLGHISSPGSGAKYCDEHVCVSVCLSAYIENHMAKFTKFSMHDACACIPTAALRYVKYFRFCGWRYVFTQWTFVTTDSCCSLSTANNKPRDQANYSQRYPAFTSWPTFSVLCLPFSLECCNIR